jgi:hypothetical protein
VILEGQKEELACTWPSTASLLHRLTVHSMRSVEDDAWVEAGRMRGRSSYRGVSIRKRPKSNTTPWRLPRVTQPGRPGRGAEHCIALLRGACLRNGRNGTNRRKLRMLTLHFERRPLEPSIQMYSAITLPFCGSLRYFSSCTFC